MKRFLFFTLLLVGFTAWAQDGAKLPDGGMSLHDCMQYAIDHSPKTRIQDLTNDSRRLDYRDAYMNFIPSVSGSSGASSSFGRSIDPETNTYTTHNSFYNSYSLAASYTLFNGFAIIDNLKATRIAQLSGVEEAQKIKDDLCLTIIQAYYNVLYQQGMVDLCRQQLEESATSLKQTRLQEELGLKGHADVLQVDAQVAANEFSLVKAQNTLKQYIITLKELMFYPTDQELLLDESYSQLIDPETFLVSSESIYHNALEFLPAVQISAFNVKTAKLVLHNAKWSLLPNLYANGNYSTNYISMLGPNASADPFMDQLRDRQGKSVSVSVSIPLFSGLHRQSNIGRKKNSLKIAEAQHDQVLRELESEIDRAVNDMAGSAKEFVQADKQVQAQEEAHRANQRKYEEGLLSILELQTSSNKNLSSKADRLNAAFSYFIKRHLVNYYQGISYLNQE